MAHEKFVNRHNGPRIEEAVEMLKVVGVSSMKELIEKTLPPSILLEKPMNLPEGLSEYEYLRHIQGIASKNKVVKSFIGMGYYETIMPSVIKRNILENPAWYTSYTPYQAEISQGRLEALLNFQTVVIELTGMEIANASLLDEATAATEAMVMMFNSRSRAAVKAQANTFFADNNIFPQTKDVLKSRAKALNIDLQFADYKTFQFTDKVFGALVQYPAANGSVEDYSEFVQKVHAVEGMVAVAADLLSLTLLVPPAEWGADIVVGSTQRFGIPMGYGGPHAGFFATQDKFKRNMPGRIIGISKDAAGNQALRMALQTREQHIKREKATSNICTAQALLATMAGFYAVYHGAEGLKRIAMHIHSMAGIIAQKVDTFGYFLQSNNFFDTVYINIPKGVRADRIMEMGLERGMNFLKAGGAAIGISVNETTTLEDVNQIIDIFAMANGVFFNGIETLKEITYFDKNFTRTSNFLDIDVFKRYRSETEMMRYMKKLERKDFSLTHSMISLGSCTMKLNAATEMMALSWGEFANIHPFAPLNQAEGYLQLFNELKADLCEITGFAGVSLQPNSGAAGEYAGLAVINAYHENNGEAHRNIVLIPASAHGTNPASAVMAGGEVVVVKCDEKGNIDIEDLKLKADKYKDQLSAFMVTYPSTHGVFEAEIMQMCNIIHECGGQVYMDGANMNAQVGLTSPGRIGADVCHLNLHKTFAIPHGGGGPGVGPIAVAKHLVPFLPSHPVVKVNDSEKAIHAVAAAPYGSALVMTISHAYIKMMGGEGLKNATEVAILNANYLAAKLKQYYDIVYTGLNGMVAHEMILECRNIKQQTGISEADIAKRLMDYGFHAPTLSFPVHGTLMVEPTESESLQELDRFIDAMKGIYNEIMEVKDGKADKENNVLKNAPHTLKSIVGEWNREYSREKAVFPLKWVADNKFFPAVARVDDAHGDRNLMCSCAPISQYISNLYE